MRRDPWGHDGTLVRSTPTPGSPRLVRPSRQPRGPVSGIELVLAFLAGVVMGGGSAPRHLRADRGHREDDRVDQVDAVGVCARTCGRVAHRGCFGAPDRIQARGRHTCPDTHRGSGGAAHGRRRLIQSQVPYRWPLAIELPTLPEFGNAPLDSATPLTGVSPCREGRDSLGLMYDDLLTIAPAWAKQAIGAVPSLQGRA